VSAAARTMPFASKATTLPMYGRCTDGAPRSPGTPAHTPPCRTARRAIGLCRACSSRSGIAMTQPHSLAPAHRERVGLLLHAALAKRDAGRREHNSGSRTPSRPSPSTRSPLSSKARRAFPVRLCRSGSPPRSPTPRPSSRWTPRRSSATARVRADAGGLGAPVRVRRLRSRGLWELDRHLFGPRQAALREDHRPHHQARDAQVVPACGLAMADRWDGQQGARRARVSAATPPRRIPGSLGNARSSPRGSLPGPWRGIADEGKAGEGEVDADLVRAPGDEAHVGEAVGAAPHDALAERVDTHAPPERAGVVG